MMTAAQILARLPYKHPFLFVDAIEEISEDGVVGSFTFVESLPFFAGHFADFPITPGVLIAESAAQIGVVCLGIFLTSSAPADGRIALSSVEMEFLKPVYPNEKITVSSKKIYFRFGKLKCSVTVYNNSNEEVAIGEISGMIKNE